MIRHYYTLYKVAEELRSLRGQFLTECFTQEKNVVLFVFETNTESATIECSIDPQSGAMFRRREFRRARKNTLDLFPALLNRSLRDVRIADNERIITLDIGAYSLHCRFFGGGKGNMLLERDGVILDAFKAPKELAGTPYTAPHDELPAMRDLPETATIRQALERSRLLLSKYYALDLCKKLALQPGALLSSLSAEQRSELELKAVQLRERCLRSQTFYLLRDKEGEPLLSLVPLDGYETERTFDTISEAIRIRLTTHKRENAFAGARDVVARNLRQQREKAERALTALERDGVASERAAERRLFAELLMAQPDMQRKGMDTITVHNWDGDSVAIPLDPTMSLVENAERYFDRARTARESADVRTQRKERYSNRLAELRAAEQEFSTVQDDESLARFLSRFSELLQTMSEQTEQRKRKYREFDLGDGYTLYVGKSAENNDELSMRFAKPNDYWFHARGVSGSHAVLRGPGTAKPLKHIIEKAASIAAYYSKSRNAGYTPVAYTQKKYVRKPKGAAVGAVMLEREEVVMVKPGLPVQEKT